MTMTDDPLNAEQKSAYSYAQLFKSHPQAMWVYDIESLQFLMVNDAAVARYGYSRQEFLKMTIRDICLQEDLSALLESIAKGPRGHEEPSVWRHRLRGGQIIFAEISSHPFDFEGRSARLIMALDVTKRLVAEQKSRESEELFRAVASVTADVIWDWNVSTDAIWWSDGLKAVFGHSPEESRRNLEFWKTHVHPDDRERVLRTTQVAMDRRQQTWKDDYRFLRSDGSTAHVEDSGYIIYDQQGNPVRFVGGMTDISARKEAEDKLTQQAALLDLARDAIIVHDIDQRVLFWNKGAERIYGWTAEEAVGRSLRELLYGGDYNSNLRAYVAAVVATGEWSGEIAQRRRDGTRITVEARCSLMRDVDGSPRSILSINSDITARLAVEEQLRQAQKLEAIGQLTGGLAHDFNNLLTVLLGNAEVLVDRLSDDKDLRRLAEMTWAAAQRGSELVHRLLAFARRQSLEPQVVDLNCLLDGLDALLRRTISQDIEIDVLQPADLWKALVDPAQLETAILNLCINARDAMPCGGRLMIETANISLDEHLADSNADTAPGQYVVMTISDTGTGMEPHVLARAFEPFFTTKEAGKGSGLGLSMVFGFAKQSNGHVKIHSQPGEGTTVKMYLPRAVQADKETTSSPSRSKLPRGSETILLVDDNELVRTYAATQLANLGYKLVPASNGQQALDALRGTTDIDLLFTDVVMPGRLSGLDLAQEARIIRPNLPILFTSGYADNGQGDLGFGIHFLRKPYRASELAVKVRLMLDGNV
ncbi:PAS domain S-box-containing protein [Sinorhizobium terangae]|uniref:histidine kinase n=1 Tax=Sinorhizobium terangae TaxID=110322 RepID=A0A6N7LRP7_SINTE|nr:PAS domain S-box protein [Sinorhizobium terangae]MBB4189240.1 PAS domain S-box-containing protein [Sinorhizobium terangae]MQX19155.1 PAS domain S-box protein [Sinorhizobium terangae]